MAILTSNRASQAGASQAETSAAAADDLNLSAAAYPPGAQVAGHRNFDDAREAINFFLHGIREGLHAVTGLQKIDFEGVTLRLQKNESGSAQYVVQLDPDIRAQAFPFPTIPAIDPKKGSSGVAGNRPEEVEQALGKLATGEIAHVCISAFELHRGAAAGLGQLHLWEDGGKIQCAFLQT